MVRSLTQIRLSQSKVIAISVFIILGKYATFMDTSLIKKCVKDTQDQSVVLGVQERQKK